MSVRTKETRPDAWKLRRETVSEETRKHCNTAADAIVTIYTLNREVDKWDARNRRAERKRGCGIPNIVRAHGGSWLVHMATLLGVRVRSVKVAGVPRPAVKYRGIWFVNFEKGDRA